MEKQSEGMNDTIIITKADNACLSYLDNGLGALSVSHLFTGVFTNKIPLALLLLQKMSQMMLMFCICFCLTNVWTVLHIASLQYSSYKACY